jgi:hypothetical protein
MSTRKKKGNILCVVHERNGSLKVGKNYTSSPQTDSIKIAIDADVFNGSKGFHIVSKLQQGKEREKKKKRGG